MTEANGHPLNFTLSKANRNDQVNVLQTVEGIRIGQRKRKPKRLGLAKGFDSGALSRLHPIGVIMFPPRKAALPKINMRNAIVGNAGRWSERSRGLTIIVVLIACWNVVKKPIVLLCELL